ncbi:hypothetical protein FPH17_00025 [Corynebacterium godavarianum]|uniref:Uncharacterized protein n=1 Tax=Corynebacterium godavarianum TaxID=2054421 RepID=A0ABY3E7S1_9CORY|nr:hypothetical protein [Corynebacterium godavarianum]TSJ76038.1 hypothetical protein FPH17_00025 [Corynebacterium godavarianum]
MCGRCPRRPRPRWRSGGSVPAPKPHDPRTTQHSPAEVTQRVQEILAEPVQSLVDEASQLTRAHDVLSDALRNQ